MRRGRAERVPPRCNGVAYFFGEVGSLPVMPRPPLPVAADAVTSPLSQAAMNSTWVSLPSLFASAALKSVTRRQVADADAAAAGHRHGASVAQEISGR